MKWTITFILMILADFASLAQSPQPITVTKGGTGASTFTSGGVLYGAGTGAIGATAAPTVSGQVLSWNGASLAWATPSGTVANALTAGTGLTSAGTFDGSVARTFAIDFGTSHTTVAYGDHTHSGVYQPADSDLTTIAGLASTDGNVIVGSGSGWVVESGATARTSLGLSIGTDVMGPTSTTLFSGTLPGTYTGTGVAAGQENSTGNAYLALVKANTIASLKFDGSNIVASHTISGSITGSAGNTVAALTAGTGLTSGGTFNGSTARTFAVDLGTGATQAAYGNHTHNTYQAADTDLTTIAGLASTDGNIIVGSAIGWVVESGATARTSLGLTIGTDVLAPNGSGASLTSLNGGAIASGTVPAARLGSGTTDATTYLAGDSTWKTLNASAVGLGNVTNIAQAPVGAYYLTIGTNGILSSEFNVSGMGTGLMKVTTGDPVLAVAGTDYEAPIAGGTTAQYWRGDKSWQTLDKTAVGLGNVTNIAQAPVGAYYLTVGTNGVLTSEVNVAGMGTGLMKLNNTSNPTLATAGTDYSAGTSGLATGILKSTTTTGVLSIATAGVDYAAVSHTHDTLTGTGSTITFDTEGDMWTLTGAKEFSSAGLITAIGFSGSGGSITGLNASNLSTGTIPYGRLSADTPATSDVLMFNGTSAVWEPVSGGSLSGGTDDKVVTWTGSTSVSSGILWDDGTRAGVGGLDPDTASGFYIGVGATDAAGYDRSGTRLNSTVTSAANAATLRVNGTVTTTGGATTWGSGVRIEQTLGATFATAANYAGIQVRPPAFTTNHPTNAYGIFVEDPSVGTSANWGLYAGGTGYIGALTAASISAASGKFSVASATGNVTTTGTLTVDGATDTVITGGAITAATVTANELVTAAPGTDHTGNGLVIQLTANEAQSAGDAVYIAADGDAALADASTEATARVVGVLLTGSVSAGGTGTYLLQGVLRDDTWAWTVGGKVYLSITGTTGNTLTQTAPSGANEAIVIIGIATHADRLYVNPQLVIVEHA